MAAAVAAEAMREVDIDITDNAPRAWTREDLENADAIVNEGLRLARLISGGRGWLQASGAPIVICC